MELYGIKTYESKKGKKTSESSEVFFSSPVALCQSAEPSPVTSPVTEPSPATLAFYLTAMFGNIKI